MCIYIYIYIHVYIYLHSPRVRVLAARVRYADANFSLVKSMYVAVHLGGGTEVRQLGQINAIRF